MYRLSQQLALRKTMQTSANVNEAKRVRPVPTFSSTKVEKWDLLQKAYIKGSSRVPANTRHMEEAASLLGPAGEQTDEWKQFWKNQKERQDKCIRKNGIAYSAIVEGCEGYNGAMLVVMQRKGIVRCIGGSVTEGVTRSTDGQQATSCRRSGRLPQVVNPAQESSTGRVVADHLSTTEPRHRMRKRRAPLNVGVLCETGGSALNAKMLRSDLSSTYV